MKASFLVLSIGFCLTFSADHVMSKEACITVDGPTPNLPCIFPFTDEGVQSTSCKSYGDIKWCPTQVDLWNHYQSHTEQWGICPNTDACNGVTKDKEAATKATEATEAATEATEAATEATEAATEAKTKATEASTEATEAATEAKTKATKAATEATKAPTEKTTEKPKPKPVCKTVDGPVRKTPCRFPFNYKGHTYFVCSNRDGKNWCATRVNSRGDYQNFSGKWGYCDKTDVCKKAEGCATTGGPVIGAKCQFPFTYKGRKYTTCIRHRASTWCPTQLNAKGEYIWKKWGYCNKDAKCKGK